MVSLQDENVQLGKVCADDEKNSLNAIRLSLHKAISSVSYRKGSKCGHVKSVTIDMPCSQHLFFSSFVSNVQTIQYCGEDKYKCFVTISDFNSMFGEN